MHDPFYHQVHTPTPSNDVALDKTVGTRVPELLQNWRHRPMVSGTVLDAGFHQALTFLSMRQITDSCSQIHHALRWLGALRLDPQTKDPELAELRQDHSELKKGLPAFPCDLRVAVRWTSSPI